MDKTGVGIAYSGGSNFGVKYLGGNFNSNSGILSFVTKSIGDGAVLKTLSGTLWEIDDYDQFDTEYWLPPYPVIITGDEMNMINLNEDKKIWVERVN